MSMTKDIEDLGCLLCGRCEYEVFGREHEVYIITAFLSERTNEIIKISTGLVFPYLIDF